MGSPAILTVLFVCLFSYHSGWLFEYQVPKPWERVGAVALIFGSVAILMFVTSLIIFLVALNKVKGN